MSEDTEWNDVLRAKGIIPPRKEKEFKEEDIVQMVEKAAAKHSNNEKQMEEMGLDELDSLEDLEDERVIQAYRQKRLEEIRSQISKAKYGDVRDISAIDYVQEVNKAGDDVWVVLHLYQSTLPLCKAINEHLIYLAKQFPAVKFLRSIATSCVPNYPDSNCPTIFIYFEGQMKTQLVGPTAFGPGPSVTKDELEWLLSQTGAFKTLLKEDPMARRASGRQNIFYGKEKKKQDESESDSDD